MRRRGAWTRRCGWLIVVMSAPCRWAAAALLVSVGWLVTPQAVPVYDGVSAPDEPYRYVAPPAGARKTAPPTAGTASSPVSEGSNTDGMSVQSAEQGPQVSLFVPPKSLASKGTAVVVTTTPKAATDQPPGARIDGNVYAIAITDKSGPVTLIAAQAAIATLYLRATTSTQAGPTMEYRSTGTGSWKALHTTRGGQDVYVSSFVGVGDYALAFPTSGKAGGSSLLPFVLLGGFVLLIVVVVVVRLRSKEPSKG